MTAQMLLKEEPGYQSDWTVYDKSQAFMSGVPSFATGAPIERRTVNRQAYQPQSFSHAESFHVFPSSK